MRKKIGKRIGPVPALLAVVALAVVAAFATIQANAVFAQEIIAEGKGCGVIFNDDGTGDFSFQTDADAINDAVKGGDCTTTDDELTVTFKLGDRDSGDAASGDLYVYRIGGNVGSMRAEMPYGFGAVEVNEQGADRGHNDYDDPPLSTVTRDDTATNDVDEFADHPLIKRTEEVGGSMMSKVGRTAGRNVEVAVTRRQADQNGRVFLFVYAVEQKDYPFSTTPTENNLTATACADTDTDTDSYIDLTTGSSVTVRRAICPEDADNEGEADTAIGTGDPLVVQVDFLGEPSTKKACGDMGDMACSSLTVETHEDNSVDVPTDGTAKATAMFMDEEGRPLPGFVTFEVMGDADVLIDESSLKTHRVEIEGGMVSVTVTGLPKSDTDDPYKIAISAMLESDAGTHTFNKSISRIGDADMVTAMAYRCDMAKMVAGVNADPDADPPVEAVTAIAICETEAEALADDDMKDPSPATVFAPNSYFLIHSTAMDSLGQDKKADVAFEIEEQPAEGESAEFGDPAEVRDANDARISGSGQNGFVAVMVPESKDIETGSYSFEIVADAGDAMTTVMITVAGKPMAHEVTGPDWIALNGIETYTVSVTDENGNPPVLPAKDDQMGDMCQVTILAQTSVADTSVQTTGLDEVDCLVIDPDTGMGEFKVLAPFGASQGDIVRITALRDGDAEIKTVMLGDVPTGPTAPGMPMNVMAEATSDTMITVTWESPADDGGSDITGYMVQRGYMDADNMMMWMDVDPAHMGMDMMYMDMGLMADTTYYYRVAAMNSSGMGDYSDGMAMAMTMAEDMPPVTMATGIIASYLPVAKTFGVTWTPAADAEQQYIVLFSLPDYEVPAGGVKVLGPDASSHEFTFDDVAAGDYEVLVATFIDGAFYYDDDTAVMVTVE